MVDHTTNTYTILAMARPGTPRRGFEPTIEALSLVKKVLPECKIILFGDRFLAYKDIPFQFRDEGIVLNQNRLAELYSEADVFLDGSDFQGFGRCALEAMACGTAGVLTGVGGVSEYGIHGKNAIIVPPKSPEKFTEAIIGVLKNATLKQKIVKGGFEVVKQFCHKRESKETLASSFSAARSPSGLVARGWLSLEPSR